jgi:hypothetical protein
MIWALLEFFTGFLFGLHLLCGLFLWCSLDQFLRIRYCQLMLRSCMMHTYK